MDTIKNPDKVKKVVEYSERVTLSLAEPSASLLSPLAYYEFYQSYVERTIKALNRTCILHIYGAITHIAEKMCESGAGELSVGEVELPWLVSIAPEDVVIAGNPSN